MKTVATVLSLLCWYLSFGQNECFCERDTLLTEIINCGIIKFDNKARLYWNFNCDSSWLTFESPGHKKKVIFSLGDGIESYTGRLGYSYAQEYKTTFLIQNRVISGCCTPSDFYLFDKATGRLRKELGLLIFYGESKKLPFAISLKHSSYDTTLTRDDNTLSVYNIDKNKTYFIKLPKGEIEKATISAGMMHPEFLFDAPVVKGSIVYLTYWTGKTKKGNERHTKTVKIDLAKYSR